MLPLPLVAGATGGAPPLAAGCEAADAGGWGELALGLGAIDAVKEALVAALAGPDEGAVPASFRVPNNILILCAPPLDIADPLVPDATDDFRLC